MLEVPTFPPRPHRGCVVTGRVPPRQAARWSRAPCLSSGAPQEGFGGCSWDFGDGHQAPSASFTPHLTQPRLSSPSAPLPPAKPQTLLWHQNHPTVPQNPSDPPQTPLEYHLGGFGAILLRRQARHEPQEGQPMARSPSQFYSRPPLVLPPAFGALNTKQEQLQAG